MTTSRPITVYLDSSDYSNMSHPNRSAGMERTRNRLIELAHLPSVSFVFSGIHISEMAPLEAHYTESASARTDLLVTLCKRNALISFDRLVKAEINHLRYQNPTPVAAVTLDGTWFPDLGQIVTPTQCIDATTEVNEQALEMGMNRKTRRLLKSKTTKHGRFRPEVLESAGGIDLHAIVERYPMRQQDAEVLMQYVLGKVSAERADQAFLESLRDPSWMMRWFHEHHGRLGTVGNWVREPARKLTGLLSDLAVLAAQALRHEERTGQMVIGDKLTAAGWKTAQDDLVLSVTNRVLAAGDPAAAPCADAKLADRFCPGLTTCIRAMHSSLRNSIGDGARQPAQSDFVDVVHAMYAPYVAFFRADRYMAPIVKAQAEKYGTVVVAKLDELPGRIEAAVVGTP